MKQSKLKEKKVLLAEAAPIGSFQYISDKVNHAIGLIDPFDPDNDGDNDGFIFIILRLSSIFSNNVNIL